MPIPRQNIRLWSAGAFGVALALALGVLALHGAGAVATREALRLTARFQFLLFWPAYTAGALVSLFGPLFEPLRRQGRAFGLAFAAALAVHLALVLRLYLIGAPPAFSTLLVFGLAAVFAYTLALFSIPRVQAMISPQALKVLYFIAMNYLAYAFLRDFLRHRQSSGVQDAFEYLPFAALAVLGPLLRLAAWSRRLANASVNRRSPTPLDLAPVQRDRAAKSHR